MNPLNFEVRYLRSSELNPNINIMKDIMVVVVVSNAHIYVIEVGSNKSNKYDII